MATSIQAKVHEAKTLYTIAANAPPALEAVEIRIDETIVLSHRQLRTLVMKMLDRLQEHSHIGPGSARKEPADLSAN